MLIVATGLALVVRFLRQPAMLGYILAGFVLGPIGAKVIGNQELLSTFSDIGITLLLFLIGLELNWAHLAKIGRSAINLAILQVSLTFGLGYGAGLLFGFDPLAASVIGFGLTFSSTIVVLQLISIKNDIHSLYGKISVALLIIQDLVAVVVLVMLNSATTGFETSIYAQLGLLGLKLVMLFAITWLIGAYIFPRLFKRLAKARDLMSLTAIAWCFLIAIIAHSIGFSFEVGAFLAGLSIAALPYNQDIFSQIRPLRDFFIVLFFVLLGFSLSPQGAIDWTLVATFVGIAIIAKPLIILVSLAAQRFRIRTSFFAASSLGQMSEFSVILAMAAANDHIISESLLSSIIVATAITFGLSSFMISKAEYIYSVLRPFLKLFQLKGVKFRFESTPKQEDHVIIFGYHRMGFHILRSLRKLKQDVLIVDFNPDVIQKLRKSKIPSVFGDASDPELLDTVHVSHAKMVISTIPYLEENLNLIKHVRIAHKKIAMICTANDIDDALLMYKEGADYVILPKLLGGEHLADILDKYKSGTLKQYLKKHGQDAKLLRTKEHELYI